MVEAAFVIPMLLMLLLGIFSFGRAYNVYQTITRAAREGARQAVLTPCAIYPNCPGSNTIYSAGDIRTNFVEPVLQSANLDPKQVKDYTTSYVLLDPDDTTPNICGVQISFQYPYTLMLPFTGVNLTTVNLSTTVQMRLENQPAPSACTGSVP